MGRRANLRTSLVMSVLLLVGISCTIAAAGVIYVDTDASGSDNGTSWINAYNYLQDGLAVASSGDKILVAEGVYKPDSNSTDPNGSGDRTRTFRIMNGVEIYGGYAGFNEPDPNARDVELYETILSGEIGAMGISDNSHNVVSASGVDSTTVLDGLTISGGQTASGRYGGGMNNINSSPTVKNCTFRANYGWGGGGMSNSSSSSPTLIKCAFIGNTAHIGGGMRNTSSSSPKMINCTFIENRVTDHTSSGGGIFHGNPKLVNCIFIGNFSENTGGAMDCLYPRLTNCTFIGNLANSGGGMYTTVPTLTNCIFWNNSDFGGKDESAQIHTSHTPIVNYSCIQGWTGSWGGAGNINLNPNLTSDGHLLSGSLCINAGDPNYEPEPNETDLDGKSRIIHGRIDMGAYESSYFNTAPVARITEGQRIIEAEGPFGAKVTLDGSCSSDSDSTPGTNDDITCFDWFRIDPCDPDFKYFLASGEIIDCNLPLGEHIILLEVIDKARALDTDEVTIVVQDTTPPEVTVIVPQPTTSLQDRVTLMAEAFDIFGVTEAYFYVREPDDGNGIPIGYEDIPSTLNSTSGRWEFDFDTTELDDGYYVVLAKAVDIHGNEGWSETVPFSIRNWVVVELLPASRHFRAGRTVPVKFTLVIDEAVDPDMPFVYNEELEIRIFDAANPGNVLQTSLYGDASTDYRIDSVGELYITNFKTAEIPAVYEVEIWRASNNFLIGAFTFNTEILGKGDLTGDGKTDFNDLVIMTENWLGNDTIADIAPDPDGDGTVDFRDFAVFAENWLEVTSQ